ncbi:MAG TPA: hypothetical protein VEN81_10200 [Planctomycetota bacterium]|nr:hypothetical protein [Planctomycetota bacterium]
MGKKGYSGDSSLHGFPRSPESTPWSVILPGSKGPIDPEVLHGRLVVLYGRFIHLFFRTALGLHGEKLKDVTQEFFRYLLETRAFTGLERGNFRGFLRLVCRRFYINRLKADHALRRDVGRNEAMGERDLAADPSAIPEVQFFEMYDATERRRYLDMALEKVREKLRDEGKEMEIDLMIDHGGTEGEKPMSYSELSEKYSMSEDTIRNKLTKVRNLLRSALLKLAAERSGDPESELRDLGLDPYLVKGR